MRKLLFYFLLIKKFLLLLVYPLFTGGGKLFYKIRLSIETYLIFQPSKLRARRLKRGLLKKIKPQRFVNLEGIRLYGWFVEPQEDKPVILFLHGQAESILSHQDVALFAIENGLGLFMLSYRGHYKSWGNPSERGLCRDAQTAISQLKMLGIDEDRIIVWGHSLGTVFALETALHNNVRGLILQSPIKEIKSAAIDVYNFYCSRLKLYLVAAWAKRFISSMNFIQKADNISKIKRVKCPILIAHSITDKIAPCTNSMELAKNNPNAQLYLCERGSHWGSEWCFERVLQFIAI